MSYAAKWPYAEVEKVARSLAESLAPFCEQIEVAGSIRRIRPLIGDIELVAVPKVQEQQDLFGDSFRTTSELWLKLDKLLKEQKITHGSPKRWGKIMRTFQLKTKRGQTYKVDLFTCFAENWGNTLLIRTGSREFSRWMVSQRRLGGALPNDVFHRDNRLFRIGDTENEPLPMFTEKDWFDLCNLPFIPAIERDGEKWLKVISK
jgi:DNA polymerase/3'-5' exonuclease PolX